jgi:hypothetical protein
MFWSWLARALSLPFSQLSAQLLPTLPEPLHGQARALWAAGAASPRITLFPIEVSKALALVGVDNLPGQLTDDGLLHADVAFVLEGRRVALETEDSGSFTANPPHLPLSDVLIRRTLLQVRGWGPAFALSLAPPTRPPCPHSAALRAAPRRRAPPPRCRTAAGTW